MISADRAIRTSMRAARAGGVRLRLGRADRLWHWPHVRHILIAPPISQETSMPYKIRGRDEHYASDGAPKRILALDGGGLRGILTLGILQRIEDILRERHGAGDDFRLSHYFDLIAGT